MAHGIEPHRSIYILEQFFAEVVKREVGLAPDLIKGAAGKIDTARFAFALDASCDVDAVPKDVVALNNDVADVDADAKRDLRFGGLFPFGHLDLHSNGAGHRVYHASEFHRIPSPVVLTIRPTCSAIAGSTISQSIASTPLACRARRLPLAGCNRRHPPPVSPLVAVQPAVPPEDPRPRLVQVIKSCRLESFQSQRVNS